MQGPPVEPSDRDDQAIEHLNHGDVADLIEILDSVIGDICYFSVFIALVDDLEDNHRKQHVAAEKDEKGYV